MRFLTFALYSPLGSFGEIAVGERRMSWVRPSRSAVLGLVAAALGYQRTDETAHQGLDASLYFAVRTEAPGRALIDYHTAQTPRSRKGQSHATRREELGSDHLNTVLSRREWRADTFFTIALWLRPNATIDLDAIAVAFRRPFFVLYVGRKAAPLGLPLNPAIVEADTFVDAFTARKPNIEERVVLQRVQVPGMARGEIACDADAPDAPVNARVERRRDAIVSRARWQFADRLERVVTPKGNWT